MLWRARRDNTPPRWSDFARVFSVFTTGALRSFLYLYKFLISPIIHLLAGPGHGCRFEPVCSEYAQQAITACGPRRGVWLAVRRISRCHPFGGSGYDPIPVISALTNTINDHSLPRGGACFIHQNRGVE